MAKILAQLLLIILVGVLAGQNFILPFFQQALLQPYLKEEAEYFNSGTLVLLAGELNKLSVASREDYLQNIQPYFGVELAQVELEELSLTEKDRQRLMEGEAVASDYRGLSIHLLLDDRKTTITIIDPAKIPAHLINEAERISMGDYWLAERHLLSLPQSRWPKAVESFGKLFDFPVALLSLNEIDYVGRGFSPQQRQQLLAGKIIALGKPHVISFDYAAEHFYKRIGNSEFVLYAGDVSGGMQSVYLKVQTLYYGLFVLLVLIPVLVWLLPNWLSMHHLSRAAERFGQGDFSARSKLVRFSSLQPLTQVFNSMADKIQDLFKLHRQLTHAVSHDLRTPLAKLEFAIELLRSSETEGQREKQLDRMEASVDELKTLIDEMLEYAKFDRLQPDLNWQSVKIPEWLFLQAEPWQNQISVEIKWQCRNGDSCMLDPHYMGRALGNLLRNGCRHGRKKILLRFIGDGDCCYLSVEDDGDGIALADREKVFEPFVRLEQSRNRDSGGAGLGLAVVSQIARWHGGSVDVDESSLGGAKFTIFWPQRGRHE